MKTKNLNKKNPKDYKRLICSASWDTKTIQKSADGALTIVGYANTRDKDRVSDVVLPEAFTKTLPEYMDNPIILYMHDWDKVCGKAVSAEIDEKGLKVKVKISGAKDCADVRTKISEGMLSTFSIGYNEIEADWDKGTATNIVSEVELLEISIVSIPCNTGAKFTPVVEEEKDDEGEPKSAPKQVKMADDVVVEVDDNFYNFFIEKANTAANDGEAVTKSLMKEWEMEFCSSTKASILEVKTLEQKILTELKDGNMTKTELAALILKLRGEKTEDAPKVEPKTDEVPTPKEDEKTDDEDEKPKEDEEEKLDDEGEEANPMSDLMGKVDLLSEAMASLLEMVSLMGAPEEGKEDEKPKEDEEEVEEEEKPKMDDEEEDEDEEEKDLEGMSDEDGLELLEELSESLEDVE